MKIPTPKEIAWAAGILEIAMIWSYMTDRRKIQIKDGLKRHYRNGKTREGPRINDKNRTIVADCFEGD
jgi:hypothetical protein